MSGVPSAEIFCLACDTCTKNVVKCSFQLDFRGFLCCLTHKERGGVCRTSYSITFVLQLKHSVLGHFNLVPGGSSVFNPGAMRVGGGAAVCRAQCNKTCVYLAADLVKG